MALKKRYPLRLVYINSSKSDQLGFKANIVNHNELLLIFETKVKFLSSAQEAISWLRSRNKAELDAIDILFFDPTTVSQGSTNQLSDFINMVSALGLLKDQIIAITDTDDSDAVWIELKHRLGHNRVFGKQDALTVGGWEPLNEVITAVAERRSDGGTTNLNFAIVKLESRVEVMGLRLDDLAEAVKDRSLDVDERIDEIRGELRILSQTIFQGPGTQTPAIVTEITEMKRMALHLDASIGNLAENIKLREKKLDNRISAIEASNSSKLDKQEEFKNTLTLKSRDLRDKVALVLIAAGVGVALELMRLGHLLDKLEGLVKALTGSGS